MITKTQIVQALFELKQENLGMHWSAADIWAQTNNENFDRHIIAETIEKLEVLVNDGFVSVIRGPIDTYRFK
jgi:hypothetical protein